MQKKRDGANGVMHIKGSYCAKAANDGEQRGQRVQRVQKMQMIGVNGCKVCKTCK